MNAECTHLFNDGLTRPKEAYMNDVANFLHDLVGDDILTRLTHYAIRRGGTWGFEIYVCEFLSGPKTGSYTAFPRVASTVVA